MIGTIECANWAGRWMRRCSEPTPVSIVPAAKSSPTPPQKTISARLSASVAAQSREAIASVLSRNRTQLGDSRKESKPVLPKSTATTATRPGRASIVARLDSGERTRTRPSRLPHTDSLATSEE